MQQNQTALRNKLINWHLECYQASGLPVTLAEEPDHSQPGRDCLSVGNYYCHYLDLKCCPVLPLET